MESFVKDPDSTLDYTFDWSDWLTGTEVISSVTWTVPSGITEDSTSNTNTSATIWLADGTADNDYEISCKITTDGGRTDERTFKVLVRER